MYYVEITFFRNVRKIIKQAFKKLYTRIAMKVIDEDSRKAYLKHYRKRH